MTVPLPAPAPAAIAGTVVSAASKTMPIHRYAICPSFDPARTFHSGRDRPLPTLQVVGETEHLVRGLYALRSAYKKPTDGGQATYSRTRSGLGFARNTCEWSRSELWDAESSQGHPRRAPV